MSRQRDNAAEYARRNERARNLYGVGYSEYERDRRARRDTVAAIKVTREQFNQREKYVRQNIIPKRERANSVLERLLGQLEPRIQRTGIMPGEPGYLESYFERTPYNEQLDFFYNREGNVIYPYAEGDDPFSEAEWDYWENYRAEYGEN